MLYILRLLRIWYLAAYYRLDLLMPQQDLAQYSFIARLIRLHPAAWFSRQKNNPLKLKHALEEMGTLAIKLGQLLATRRDLIAPEILQQLTLLQDQVRAFDSEQAKARIENALAKEITVLFSHFDETPLAAASIAQVHTATFPDGREVVVKVTRPDIQQQILQDFEILKWLGNHLELRYEAARALHLLDIIHDYQRVILNELDLTLEADNTRRMRRYFFNSPLIYVPKIYLESRDVMVAERIYGVPISDIATFERLGVNRQLLAERGLQVFFTQVFRDNFFHADMHAGNIFVDIQNPQDPKYIALDCAIMGELSKQDQLTVARMLLAVMNQDFEQLIVILDQAHWIPAETDQALLAKEMKKVITPMIAKPIHELDFAGILLQIMDIARRFHLEIPPQLMLLLKTLVHVEGLGTSLYPELDIWKLAKPIIQDWLKQQINPIKNIKDFGRKLPNLLFAQSDSTIAMQGESKQYLIWQQRQNKTLQHLRSQIYLNQQRNWLYGSLLLFCLSLAIVTPLPWSIFFFILAAIVVLLRILI